MKKIIYFTLCFALIMASCASKKTQSSESTPQVVTSSKSYQCTGKVISIDSKDIGRGAAAGKMNATVVKLQVTSSINKEIKQGDIISCELIPSTKVTPVVGREYVFKAKYIHPAHADGIYLLETNVMDLIR